MSPGAEYLTQLSTLRHKPAQIRWIQLRVFTLYSTCTQYLSHSPLLHPSCCSLSWVPACMKIRATASMMPHQRVEDMRSKSDTNLQIPLWEFNSKAQPLFVLKLTHYLATQCSYHTATDHIPETGQLGLEDAESINIWKNFRCYYSKQCVD